MNLKPNPDNPRTISKDAFEKLKAKIERNPDGLSANKIVHKDGIIIAGNQRWRALEALGIEPKDDWLKDVSDWTDEQIREYLVVSNISDGEWDFGLLAEQYELEELDAWGLELPNGIDPTAEVEEDEAPEVSDEPPESKLGDVYQLGRHRVMCGDSTDKASVELLMGGSQVKFIFTSPPYADMREYNGGKELSTEMLVQFISAFSPYTDCQIVNLGISKKDGDINEYWQDYITEARNNGYKLGGWNVWVKSTVSVAQETHYTFPCYHEFIFVFERAKQQIHPTADKKHKGYVTGGTTRRMADGSTKFTSRGTSLSYDKKKMSSVTQTNSELGSIRADHPATYPIELPIEYIKALSTQGDTISDPFLGSGSTLIACEQTDRTCYGMELDPKYVDVIRKRYAKFTNDNELPDNWAELTPALTGKEQAK